MIKQYKIVELGRAGRYLDFSEAILVKIVEADEYDYYQDIKDEKNCEEEIMQLESWLMFKYSRKKANTLIELSERCDNGKVWYLDLEKDFICRPTSITNQKTGEGFMRPIYQVVMVDDNLDMLDAQSEGRAYNGRTGIQKHLDELNLPLEGVDLKYYVIGRSNSGTLLGIPYDYNEESHGMYYLDDIEIHLDGEVSVRRRKVALYNPLTRQVFSIAL